MRFKVEIFYETNADDVVKGKETVEEIIKAVGFSNFTVTHLEKQRTISQNAAAHKWFSQIEEHCRDRGLTADALFKEPAELPITRHMIKDFFRMVEQHMYHKESTADLDKHEFSEVVKVCEREYAKRLDSTIPFPSIEHH